VGAHLAAYMLPKLAAMSRTYPRNVHHVVVFLRSAEPLGSRRGSTKESGAKVIGKAAAAIGSQQARLPSHSAASGEGATMGVAKRTLVPEAHERSR